MEELGYKKSYKARKYMAAGSPIIGLLGILAYWIFLVEPSRGSSVIVEFKWWVPLFAAALLIWAIFEIKKASVISNFRVRLYEDGIEVAGDRVSWTDMSNVEFKKALGQEPAVIIHASDGRTLNVPAAIESYAYIEGVIQSHTTPATES